MTIDILSFKDRLVSEKNTLTEELAQIAERNPGMEGDWIAKDQEVDPTPVSDENEFADKIEERLENQAVQDVLERRLRDVVHALEKIESGTFGICEIAGTPIEEDRLNANPAARTCKKHLNDEGALPL